MRTLACLVLTLVLLAFAAIAFGGQGMVVWSQITHGMQALRTLSETAPWAAAALYMLAYATLIMACLPVGPAMSVTGGALLGVWAGTACATGAITAGSVLFFLGARTTLGVALARRRGALIARIRPRLERDGFYALLALRIAPIMPSWLLNLAAALAGMRLRPFAAASALGVLPATAVFASAGAGLGDALAQGAPPGLDIVARPAVLLPLLCLSAMALLPVLLRVSGRRT